LTVSLQSNFANPPRRNRAENRDFRRASLIQAAIAVVAEHDITGATVERICERAGVSRGLIGHYFDNKEHLLVVALQSQFSRAVALKREIANHPAKDAAETLKSMMKVSFSSPVYDREQMAAWQAFTNASRSNAAYRPPISRVGRELHRLFESLFAQAADARHIKIDASLAAFGLVTILDGLWNSLATGKDEASTDDALRACELFIEGCLR